MEMNSWKSYYVSNDLILKLIKSYKTLSIEDKRKKREEILELLSYLIFSRTKGYKDKIYYEDLLQESRIGLLKAVEEFDVERGINFFKLAVWKIQHRINMYMSNHNRFLKRPNIECESTINPLDNFDEIDKSRVLRKEINYLSKTEKRIIIMRFGILGSEKYTLKQIGDTFNISKQYVQQIEHKAIKKLSKNKNIKEVYVR